MPKSTSTTFTGYEKLVILLLSLTQFSVVLDFMVMAPLGDLLQKSLHLKPATFGLIVSAYAFSAGASGLLTAGFADRFDRKKILLFFYIGFIIGTFFCGIANSFTTLFFARIFTGIFGGVIGSISLAIITDLFGMEKRGRAMGFMQMGFGASQVLGIPIGLFLANKWGWEAPFLLIVAFAILVAGALLFYLKPVADHLNQQKSQNALQHFWKTLSKKQYSLGFITTAFLSIGGFMMMPYGTIFAVNNIGVTSEQLPILFMISGITSLIVMPFIGKLSDQWSKIKLFTIASIGMIVVCLIYTNLSTTPFYLVVLINMLLMTIIMSRMVPSSTLISAVPEMHDRGAFMSINASLQQMAGGFAAVIAGLIVTQANESAPLENYHIVGYVVCCVTVVTIVLMYKIQQLVQKK